MDTGLTVASTAAHLPAQYLCVAIIAVNSGLYRYIPQPLKPIIQRGRFSVVRRFLRYGVYTWGQLMAVLPIYHENPHGPLAEVAKKLHCLVALCIIALQQVLQYSLLFVWLVRLLWYVRMGLRYNCVHSQLATSSIYMCVNNI